MVAARMIRVLIFAGAACALLLGCSVPIAGGLDEPDANQAVAVLERAGLDASKDRDPELEGRYRISVPRPEAKGAIAILSEENLPPKLRPGVLEALGQGGVIPSRLAEHARWTVGVEGDLERSLRTLDGVLSARVHLAVPEENALAESNERPTASVLVRHRGATPPLAAAEIQRLVSGAIPGLSPDQVNVVMASAPVLAARTPELTHLGPLTTTKSSGVTLRLGAGVMILFNLLLLGALLFLWSRLRRAESALISAQTAAENESPRARK
jgi:type III secretion protein J